MTRRALVVAFMYFSLVYFSCNSEVYGSCLISARGYNGILYAAVPLCTKIGTKQPQDQGGGSRGGLLVVNGRRYEPFGRCSNIPRCGIIPSFV